MTLPCSTREEGCNRPDADGWVYEYWADEDGEHKGERLYRIPVVVARDSDGGEIRTTDYPQISPWPPRMTEDEFRARTLEIAERNSNTLSFMSAALLRMAGMAEARIMDDGELQVETIDESEPNLRLVPSETQVRRGAGNEILAWLFYPPQPFADTMEILCTPDADAFPGFRCELTTKGVGGQRNKYRMRFTTPDDMVVP